MRSRLIGVVTHDGSGTVDMLKIRRVHVANYGVYGARKVWRQLRREASRWPGAPWSAGEYMSPYQSVRTPVSRRDSARHIPSSRHR
jgi:HTH-like domain